MSFELNRAITHVGVIPPVIGYLIFRKALRTLPASKHGAELRVRHAQHIHSEEIAVYPRVQNAWTFYVSGGILVNFFKEVIISPSEEKKRYGHPLWMNIASHFD